MPAILPFRAGFLDELASLSGELRAPLEKLAAAPVKETRKGWLHPNSRSGRRSMRVDTMLRKEKDGSLGGYKLATVLEALSKYGFANTPVPFADAGDKGASPRVKKPGDVPSRDDVDDQTPNRRDGREFVTVDHMPGTQLNNVAATNLPQERTA